MTLNSRQWEQREADEQSREERRDRDARFADGTTDDELRLAYARSRTDGITIDAALMLGRKEQRERTN